MGTFFEVKISYEKIMENGMQKKVTEPYLVDALSHAEAEERAIVELNPYISGDFTIASVRRANISEMFFNENGNRWYKAKINFITLDEKSGAEKKTAVTMYAQACDIQEALAVIKDGMKGTLADYTIVSIAETPVIDVFIYGKA